ncbi:hypothetical protein VH571_10500 [Frondihabitans sp. 4ASC-45]|uniref:hypothetical protein n=1 Tax=Frondihabitans sp. 4ASC-45 TaxID=3111636 RepID=UPI003C1A5FEE
MPEQLRHLRDRCVIQFWFDAIPDAYGSIDATRIREPRQWRHLKRPSEACLGEALGNGVVYSHHSDDLHPQEIDYDPRWAS